MTVHERRVGDAVLDGERLLGADGKKDYDEKVKLLEAVKKEQVPVDKALVVTERGPTPAETFVLYRGNPHAEKKPEKIVIETSQTDSLYN